MINKKRPTYFNGSITILLAILIMVATAFALPGNPIQEILKRLKYATANFPQEKLYLHLDKPMYAAGEDIWFKAYLVDASFHTPDSISRVIYVELFDQHKTLLNKQILPLQKDSTYGNFHLVDTLHAGNYGIRAYTNYMKNQGEDFFFQKQILVIGHNNQEQKLPEPGPIDLQFFAEGGNLLAGVINRVAFKAIDHYGKGVDVEGDILNERDSLVTSFKSEHNGMGVINIMVGAGQAYKAIVKNKKNVLPVYTLPQVNNKGYLLRVTDNTSKLRVVIYNNLTGVSSTDKLHLVAHCRGVTCYAASSPASKSTFTVYIEKSSLPTGILHFTVFTDSLKPVCERLFFINHEKDKLKLTVRTEKTVYTKREKVNVELKAQDYLGSAANGSFSLSVYDAKVKNPEQYPSSISSYLFLSSDLKGTIEEPGYYFKDSLLTTKKHLDLVMMTHGWRRFKWSDVLKDTLQQIAYLPEQSIVMSGKVMRLLGNRPASGSHVKIMNTSLGVFISKTVDEKGMFYINGLYYYDSSDFAIQTDNIQGKKADLRLTVNPFNSSPPLSMNPLPFTTSLDNDAFLHQSENRNALEKAFKVRNEHTLLNEVIVVGKKITVEDERNKKGMYGIPDVRIDMAKIPLGYSDIFQVLQGRVPGLTVSGASPHYSAQIAGRGTPLFVLDGMVIPISEVANISISDVDYIDEKGGASAAIAYGPNGGGGVIAIYTKMGKGHSAPDYGVTRIKYPGFTRAKEFYSPKYTTSTPDYNNPDVRTTLYWNPSIKLKTSGNAIVSFFTSDVTANYNVVVEGISDGGMPGVTYYNFEVK